MRRAAAELGFNKRNPTIIAAINELVRRRKAMQVMHPSMPMQCNFDEFVDALRSVLNDTTSERGMRHIFVQFADPATKTITLHSLRNVARELREDMSHEDVHHMLQKGASDNDEITFDDF